MILTISVISLLLALIYVAVVLFFRVGWGRIPYYRVRGQEPVTTVSILIAARNEAERIHLTIDDLLAQDYPAELVEIIIVDDHSTDDTARIIASYAHRGVKLIQLNEDKPLNSYKKKAISEAIRIAQGELVVSTDADCRMSPNWLRTVVDCFERTSCQLVSSPVIYFEEKSLFERVQTLEFLYLIGLGAAMIGNRRPSTCNGANMAYRRSVFFELGGFSGIDHLASGDDELFLHKVVSKYPDGVQFCKSYDAVVFTHAKPNLREFLHQRKRWASKTTSYKDLSIVVMGVAIWSFNVSLLVNLAAGFFHPVLWAVAGGAWVAKFAAEWVFLLPVTRFARRPSLIFLLCFLTIFHVVYMVYIGLAGNSGKYAWKGRMVR